MAATYEQVKEAEKRAAAEAEQKLSKQFGDDYTFVCDIRATPKSVRGIRVRAETDKAPVTRPIGARQAPAAAPTANR